MLLYLSIQFDMTHSLVDGDDLFVGDEDLSSTVPRKVRGIPVVGFTFGTSNLLS